MTQLATLQGDLGRCETGQNVVTVRRLTKIDDAIDIPRPVLLAELRLRKQCATIRVFKGRSGRLEAHRHRRRIKYHEAGHRATVDDTVPIGATGEQQGSLGGFDKFCRRLSPWPIHRHPSAGQCVRHCADCVTAQVNRTVQHRYDFVSVRSACDASAALHALHPAGKVDTHSDHPHVTLGLLIIATAPEAAST